jgi:hypothetical protein
VAACVYMRSLNVRHLAVFIYDDADASQFYTNLKQVAPRYGIVVYPFEFGANPHNETYKLEEAVDNLRSSGINYIIGALHDPLLPNYVETNRLVLEYLIDSGLLGSPEYFWVFTQSLYYQFDEADPNLFRGTNEKIAKALNHTALLTLHGEIHTEDDSNLDEAIFDFVRDPDFWIYFESVRELRPLLPRPIPFSFYPEDVAKLFQLQQLWTYDAVMAYGLAACQTSNETLFSGPELYDLIIRLNYTGASGTIKFNTETGLRDATSADYYLANVIMYNASAEYQGWNSTLNDTHGDFAAKFIDKIRILPSTGEIATQEELLYPLEAKSPPKPYFSIVDLVPMGVNAFCWSLAGLVLVLSAGFGIGTVANRKQRKVKASQPIFLVLCCAGTTLIGCSTLLVPFQEDVIFNDAVLSVLCMLQVWFLSIGVTVAFAALFAKT